MKRNISILAMVVAVSTPVLAKPSMHFDPPDLGYEYQLHRQFSERRGGRSISAGHSESYRLQKSETLWTLSEMLYGDGQYWPRVWANNKQISNPNLVRPGHELQLVLGSEDDAPAFRFSEEGDLGVELAASSSSAPVVEIPPSDIPPRPILKLPTSFPQWQSIYRTRDAGFTDDRDLGKTLGPMADLRWLTAYVQESPLVPQGHYIENDFEAGLPVTNQYVYVKVRRGMGTVGQHMLVARDLGPLKKMHKQWVGKEPAYLIQIAAELELTESVSTNSKNEKDNREFETFRALILRTSGMSYKDHVLIDGRMQTLSLDKKGPSGSAQAQVIGSEKHSASTVFGPGELVFLNRGASQGVEVGQVFSVFSDRTIRMRETSVTYSPVPSGLIKVVRVSGRLATAVVLESRESMQQGDLAKERISRRDSERAEVSYGTQGAMRTDDDELDESDDGAPSVGAAPSEPNGPSEDDEINDEIDDSESF